MLLHPGLHRVVCCCPSSSSGVGHRGTAPTLGCASPAAAPAAAVLQHHIRPGSAIDGDAARDLCRGSPSHAAEGEDVQECGLACNRLGVCVFVCGGGGSGVETGGGGGFEHAEGEDVGVMTCLRRNGCSRGDERMLGSGI